MPLFILALTACNPDGRSEWQALQTSAQNESKTGNTADAEEHFQAAIKIADELQNTELIVLSLLSLSDFYYKSGQSEKCSPLLTRAHALSEKQLKESASNAQQKLLWHNLTARSALARANVYRDHGQFIESEPLYKRAAELVDAPGTKLTEDKTTSGTRPTDDTTSATAFSSTGNTTTAGDTTLTSAQLAAAIHKDFTIMEEHRHKSDDVFDDMMLQNKDYTPTERYKQKLSYDNLHKDYSALEIGEKSDLSEQKLKQRLSEAKNLFGIREGRYRIAFSGLFNYYSATFQYDKARVLLDNDIKEFLLAENFTSAEVEGDPEKITDIQILASDLHKRGELMSQKGLHYSNLPYRERALALRERWGPKGLEFVVTRRALADAYVTIHNYPAAIVQLEKALLLFDEVEKTLYPTKRDPINRYFMLASISKIEQIEGSFTEAARHLKQAEAVLNIRPVPHPDLIPTHSMNLAELAGAAGNFKEQKAHIESALNYCKTHKTESPAMQVTVYFLAGHFYFTNHDFENALKYFQLVQDRIKSGPKFPGQNGIYFDSAILAAHTHAGMGDADAAERMLQIGDRFFIERNVHDVKFKTQIALGKGNVKRKLGQFAQAQKWYEAATAESQKLPSEFPEYYWNALTSQSTNELLLKNYATARSITEKSLAVAQKSEFRSDLVSRSLSLLGWGAALNGDSTAAQNYLNEGIAVCDSSLAPLDGVIAELHINKAKAFFVQKDDDKAKVEMETAHRYLQKVHTNFESALLEWQINNFLRNNRRPPKDANMPPEKIRQFVEFAGVHAQGFEHATNFLYGAALLNWTGRSNEARQFEKMSRQARDAELKRRAVQ